MINDPQIPEQDNIDVYSDKCVNMTLSLPRGNNNGMEHATVKHRITDDNYLPADTASKWVMIDFRMYEME